MFAKTLKKVIRRIFESTGYTYHRIEKGHFKHDGLDTIHNHDFMSSPDFMRAYNRGLAASGADFHCYWRTHVILWAAHTASQLRGDFVECGVNRGFMSSAIMKDLNWDRVGRTFYLMDTFQGIVPGLLTEKEQAGGTLGHNQGDFYTRNVDEVRANFSEWKNVKIVVGAVPDTLPQVQASEVAFLHLDMNCANPEVAAFKYFWPLMPAGGIVVLDDYAYYGYPEQKVALDAAASEFGMRILSLPTGQGLMVKPEIGPAVH